MSGNELSTPVNTYFKYTTLNRKHILKSTECACIYCFSRFAPDEIEEYCYDRDKNGNVLPDTALCPKCGIDSVVPNKRIKYTDELLIKWHEIGWGNNEDIEADRNKN